MADYGVGALGGVVLIDPTTGLPYKAVGGGGGGAVDSVNGKTGAVVLSAGDVGARASGNVPWADVSGKPTTFAPTIGTTATTAVAGNDARLAKADTAVQPAGLTKAALGLGSVDNTSDANKPVSTAQAAAIAAVAASVTALDIESVSRNVMVVTGDEPRPAGAYCIWNDLREGEVSEPTNMLATDSWFRPRVGPTPVAPTIITTALGAMTQSSSTSQQLAATGTAPITWAVTAGTLPTGLTLSTGGLLAGTPSGSGAYDFTVTATNSVGNDVQQYTGTIAVASSARHVLPDNYGTPLVGDDGGGSLYSSNRFYSTGGVSFRVLGARFFVPPGATGAFLTEQLTFHLYAENWTGVSLSMAPYATPIQSKSHVGPRVAGTWIEVLFDAPTTFSAASTTGPGPDVATIAMRSASGNFYGSEVAKISTEWIASINLDGVGFADSDMLNGGNSITTGGSTKATWYGIDMIYEVI